MWGCLGLVGFGLGLFNLSAKSFLVTTCVVRHSKEPIEVLRQELKNDFFYCEIGWRKIAEIVPNFGVSIG